jgi:hypothetical protein
MSVQRTKNFIKIDIQNTQAFVTGSVPSKNVTWTSEQGLTIPQARALMDGIVNAVNFVSVRAGIRKPKRGNPAKIVETDHELFTKRLLLHSDDNFFVTTRRSMREYGIYTKPVLDVDGMTCDLATAMQAVGSIGKSIDSALSWR